MSTPTNFDIGESLETVWEALWDYRENSIPEGDEPNDECWDDICTAMAFALFTAADDGGCD